MLALRRVPSHEPLPPVDRTARRSEGRVLPRAVVDPNLNAPDPAVVRRPGDPTDDDVTRVDFLAVAGSIDPAGQLDRRLGGPAARRPVRLLLGVRGQRHPGDPLR